MILKGSTREALRAGAVKGRKVIYAWDKACIDYHFWSHAKNTAGVYFITQEKSNSAAEICSADLLDRNDSRNEGILSDQHVGTSNGVMLRRIVYVDPRDNNTYTYLTNEFTLPAYLMVLIYKLRWDIEKVFHQLKSKFEERKSWASSKTAKKNHGIFECLTHNLLLLAEMKLKDEGLKDEVEAKKQIARSRTRRDRNGDLMKKGENTINTAIQRATQRTVRFIRWLRNHIYQKTHLSQAINRLRDVWAC